jgi:hypothetical protein
MPLWMQYLSKKSEIFGEHVCLVLASRCTNSYKILIFGLGVMPQKKNYFKFRAPRADQKTFYFLTFLSWIFFHRFLTKFLIISST